MKSRTSGVNPRTFFQGFQRAVLATNSNNWSNNTSQADIATWNALALVNPSTNVFGQTLYLSGQQLFCQLNHNLLSTGFAAMPDLNVNPFTSLSIVADHAAGGSLILTLGIPAAIGTPISYFWAAAPQSPGTNFISSRLRCLGGYGTPATPFDLSTAYKARFGATSIQLGRKYFVLASILNADNGAVSAGIIAQTIGI